MRDGKFFKCNAGIKSGLFVTGVSGPGMEANLWHPTTLCQMSSVFVISG